MSSYERPRRHTGLEKRGGIARAPKESGTSHISYPLSVKPLDLTALAQCTTDPNCREGETKNTLTAGKTAGLGGAGAQSCDFCCCRNVKRTRRASSISHNALASTAIPKGSSCRSAPCCAPRAPGRRAVLSSELHEGTDRPIAGSTNVTAYDVPKEGAVDKKKQAARTTCWTRIQRGRNIAQGRLKRGSRRPLPSEQGSRHAEYAMRTAF